ncbi:MAG TPA: AI-2E family transporter [Anaerolineales bacterium]
MADNFQALSRILVLLLAILAGLWIAEQIGAVIEVLVVAGLLAYLLHPAAAWLAQRSRLSYAAASRLVFFTSVALLIAVPASLGTVAWTRLRSDLRSDLDAIAAEIERWFAVLSQNLNIDISAQEFIAALGPGLASSLAPLPLRSFGLLSEVSINIFWVLLVFVVTYYLLKDGPVIKRWLLERVPEDHCDETERLVEELDKVWRVFLRVQLLIFAILALLMTLGTLGVIWLFRSGLLAFSPLLLVVLLVAVYTAAQQVDNLWLRPRWMGRHLSLHPGLVIASLIAALALGGILLALLIVPCLATIRVLGGYLYRKLRDLPAWPDAESAPGQHVGTPS